MIFHLYSLISRLLSCFLIQIIIVIATITEPCCDIIVVTSTHLCISGLIISQKHGFFKELLNLFVIYASAYFLIAKKAFIL